MTSVLRNFTPSQFFVFTRLFAIYLVYLFCKILPLYFEQGGFRIKYFNFFSESLSDKYVFIFFGIIAGLLFLGLFRRWLAFFLFLFWIIECNQLVFKNNPGTFMVAYLLLILAATPTGTEWGVKAIPWRLCWLLLLSQLLFDFFTHLQFFMDLPAFGIIAEYQVRPSPFWLKFKLATLMTFFVMMLFSRLRFFAWLVLFLATGAWLIHFDPQDSTLIILISLLFLFNGSWLTEKADPKLKSIIFFDGICILCNRFTHFIYKEDFAQHFFYSPLQGITAKEVLPRNRVNQPNSLIFLQGGKIYEKSEAIIRIFSELGGIWTFFAIARLIPKALADRFYDLIASNRYSWFGSLNECQIPDAIEKALQKP